MMKNKTDINIYHLSYNFFKLIILHLQGIKNMHIYSLIQQQQLLNALSLLYLLHGHWQVTQFNIYIKYCNKKWHNLTKAIICVC